MTICERMFSIMEEKNIKSVQLAQKLNINKSVISSWKKRNSNPPIEYTIQICELLNISVYELLGQEPNNEIERIYKMLSAEDKQIVDIIFNKYREKELQREKSSGLKIG